MDPAFFADNWKELVHLGLRWFHVFAAILWIGSTAFFTWLDTRMTVEADPKTGREQVWMVHSGGFYLVEKLKKPELMPRELHWFKWEAAFTWITGFLLLGIVYYHGANLLWPESEMRKGIGIAIGVGSLIAGWAIYDLLWSSPLGRSFALSATICFGLLIAAAWGFSEIFTGRAAYIHVGAIMGTIMAANVWMRIIPAQRRMVEATRQGVEPDMTQGVRAKERSKHNTFMAIPVTMIMISNHFPTISYGHTLGWALLAGYVVVGFAARKMINMHDAKRAREAGG